MILLSIETASTVVGAALVTDEGPRSSVTFRGAKHHVELLHSAIAQLLEQEGIALGDLDGIAVDVGPGLFTGLRVGVATAKGLALGAALPIAAVRSTEVLRSGASVADVVVAVLDVRRGEVAFELPGDSAASIAPVEVLLDRLDPLVSNGPALLLGDGAMTYRGSFEARFGDRVRFAPGELNLPSPAVLGRLGLEQLASGAVTDALHVAVSYLRAADVAITWTTRADEALAIKGGG